MKVTVIGAGLAGLNCARILQNANHEVRVIEATSRLGGRVNTDYIDGFQLDHGFQVINPAYAELKKAGVVDDLKLKSLPKGVEILKSGQLIKVGDPLSDLSYLFGDLSKSTGTILEKINFLKFMFSNSGDIALSSAIKPTSLFYLEVIKPFCLEFFSVIQMRFLQRWQESCCTGLERATLGFQKMAWLRYQKLWRKT